jgi:hypothetical protein
MAYNESSPVIKRDHAANDGRPGTTALFAELPRGHFGAILADPPWRFATWSDNGKGRSAERHYATMTIDGLRTLDVASLAAPDCVLCCGRRSRCCRRHWS